MQFLFNCANFYFLFRTTFVLRRKHLFAIKDSFRIAKSLRITSIIYIAIANNLITQFDTLYKM